MAKQNERLVSRSYLEMQNMVWFWNKIDSNVRRIYLSVWLKFHLSFKYYATGKLYLKVEFLFWKIHKQNSTGLSVVD